MAQQGKLSVDDVVGSGSAGRRQSLAVAYFGSVVAEVGSAPFHVEVYGQEHLRHAPGALVLFNHRRDYDGAILGRTLLQRRFLRFSGVTPYFVAREDLFHPGFLADYLPTCPDLMRSAFGRIRLAAVLRWLQLRPMRRIPEYTLGELLRDLLAFAGDVPLAEVLRPDWVARFADRLGIPRADVSISQALRAPRSLLFERHAFRKLRLETLRAVKSYERRIIDTQLDEFVGLLEAGETVVLNPEGKVSTDGRFQASRRALHHLLNQPTRAVPVLPVALSYDAMSTGRTRVLVRFGSPRHTLRGLSRRETDIASRRTVLEQWPITASHLTACYLKRVERSGKRRISVQGLSRFFSSCIEQCRQRGVVLDPLLLDDDSRAARQADCLAFWLSGGDRAANRLDLLSYLNNELDAIADVYPELIPAEAP